MFLGHFGVALAAKKAAPKASLGTLFLAAQLADLLWPVFLVLGWEQVRVEPGNTRITPLDFVAYPWSHSLVMQIVWAVLLALIYFAVRRDARTAFIVGACVPTHWLLDWITHRPDMPLVPGGARYGLGLWNSPVATLLAEFGLFALGAAIYLRVTKPKDRTGIGALWSLLIFLVIVYISSTFGPPPPSPRVIGYMGLALWLLVPWAAWADRHRAVA
jgi:membrane-bound metal-dependent hydrolase YbcI (DUF457 family)